MWFRLWKRWVYLPKFDNFDKDFCADCDLEAVEDFDVGDYHEDCEVCGCRFDMATEIGNYMSYTNMIDGDLTDLWSQAGKIMCASCAVDFENEQAE